MPFAMRQRARAFGAARYSVVAALVSGCIPGVSGSNTGNGSGGEEPPGGVGFASGPPPVFEAARSALETTPPLSGGTLRVLADGRTAVAADPDRDKIFVVDYRKESLLATVSLQAGDEPGRVEQDGAGRVHVVLRRAGALLTLDPTSWSVVGRRAVCATPRGVAYDAGQDLIHVACADGTLVSLAPAPDGAVTRRLTLDDDLRDVIVDGDALLVSRFRSAMVLTIDRQGKVTQRTTPPSSDSFRMTRVGFQMASLEPAVAWRLVPLAVGSTLMVHQRADSGIIDTQPGGYAGFSCGGIVESVVSNVGVLGSPQPAPAVMGSVLPVDLAVSPDRKMAALVSAGNARQSPSFQSAQVQVIDMGVVMNPPGPGGCVSSPPLPAMPSSSPSTAPMPMVVHQPGDVLSDNVAGLTQPRGEAVAVAYDPGGHILIQTREPATIQIVTSTGSTILLSRDSRLDTGHAIFHANSGGGLACASCHPEGGDDGRVWRFGDPKDAKAAQARRTQNLRGGIMATAPFHWNGDLADTGHLMSEVFVKRMGGPSLDTDHVETLRKWLDRIPALPHDAPADPQAVERGRVLFAQGAAACASCHAGATLTNNVTTDVGTGRAFQVPSLRGVRYRAPYMHDGCASNLAQRFAAGCGGGDRHGATSSLSPDQISDLVAFMDSL